MIVILFTSILELSSERLYYLVSLNRKKSTAESSQGTLPIRFGGCPSARVSSQPNNEPGSIHKANGLKVLHFRLSGMVADGRLVAP